MKTYLMPPVTSKELATILAALRCYEQNPRKSEHFDGVSSVPGRAYVGNLCIKLNTESVVCGP